MVKQCMALIDSQCSLCNAAVTHCLCAVGLFILCFSFFFLMCSASGQVAWGGDSVKRVILNCTGVGGSQNKIRTRRRHHSQMIIQRHTSLGPSGLISSSLWPNPNRRSHCSGTYLQWSRTWICFCDNTADVREMYCITKSGIR